MKGCVKQALTELQHAHSGRFHPAPSRMATPNFGADRKAHRRFAGNRNPVLCLSETKMSAGLSVSSVLWQNPTTLVSTSGREKPAVGGEQMPGNQLSLPAHSVLRLLHTMGWQLTDCDFFISFWVPRFWAPTVRVQLARPLGGKLRASLDQ